MDPSLSLSLVPYKRKRDEYYPGFADEPFHCCRRLELPIELSDADHSVGIEPRTKDLTSKLRLLRDPDPSIIEISGSDKTTLGMDLSLSLYLVPSKRQRDEDFSCFKRPKHDVFLSYLKEEIGKSFLSYLKGDLQRYGFDVSDCNTLPICLDETSELLKAIKESWIYVVVFSIEYPFSEKCLDELVLICDSVSKSNNNKRRVFPIFYDVDPSHVRSQQDGSFLQAFQKHHDNHVDNERVEKWKHALKDIGNRSGEVFRSGKNEAKFVRKIVKQLGKLKLPLELFCAEHPVGIEPRAKDLISKLSLGDPDPSITAVLGMSGSGKTTLVKAVFDRIVPDFDASCFIENVRCYKDDNWIFALKRDVISRFNGFDYGIYNYNVLASSNIIKCVRNQKVLLVLDDVVKYEQLQALGIRDPAAFAPGSRILVTTTNKQSLCGLKNYTSYDIKLLNESESSELFTGLAYEKGESSNKIFVDEIVYLAGGVPLVLEVWGCYFKGHENKKWPRLLEKLRRIPHEDIQGKLKGSYDSLSPTAKNLFLDIACFFDGMDRDLVVKVLEDEDNAFFPDIEIQDLIDKYLVKEETTGRLTMHDVIRDMGREVVRQENEDDPGQRSRLVGRDVFRVLRDSSGTDSIRSIRLDDEYLYNYLYLYELDELVNIQVDRALTNMSNLRFIKLDHMDDYWYNRDNPDDWDKSFYFSSNDETMTPLCFKHLKYLYWEGLPYKSLDKFDMENVVVIKLFYSKLEILWEGAFKSLKKLRILEVNDAYELKRTWSFIGLENLERLDLRGCENLEELDCSIRCLQKLVTLHLFRCNRLKMVPWEMIHKLMSLVELNLRRCPNFMNIYHELWNLPNILRIEYI